jgi:hypothetical protein
MSWSRLAGMLVTRCRWAGALVSQREPAGVLVNRCRWAGALVSQREPAGVLVSRCLWAGVLVSQFGLADVLVAKARSTRPESSRLRTQLTLRIAWRARPAPGAGPASAGPGS